MKLFTEEEAGAIETDAAKRFNGRTKLVEVPEFDLMVVVAPHDRESYGRREDAGAQDRQTAYHGVLLERVLYPDLITLEAMRQSCPMLPEFVADKLDDEAGFTGVFAAIAPLNLARLPTGLDAPTASRLVTDAGKSKLWTVERADLGFACVMKAPLADIWIAARTLHGDAVARQKGIMSSLEPYVLGAVVWQSVPLAIDGSKVGLLDSKPGLFWDLKRCYMRMGGDGAAVRCKSLRDAVARDSRGSKPAV